MLLTVVFAATEATAMGSNYYGLQPAPGTGEDLSNSADLNATSTDPEFPRAYGIYAEGIGDITNSAHIIASANASNYGSTLAVGIYADQSGSILHNATISATAYHTDQASAHGIQAMGGDGGITNSGSVFVRAEADSSNAYGIDADTVAGNIANTGEINVSAIGTDNADAYGIKALSTIGNIANTGDITIEADEWGAGIFADVTDGNIFSSGSISTTAVNVAWGIYAPNTSGNISNSGNIEAQARWWAKGIYGYATSGNLTNSGKISLLAEDGTDSEVIGIASYYTNGDTINSGTINATAQSENSARAYGILAQETLGGILNSGSILADAEAHNTFAAGIEARDTRGDITNSGLIEAYARSMTSGAYGLNIDGSDADVLNTGDILAYAESDVSTSAWGINAYDVDGSILNSGSVTATTFSAGFARAFALYATETGAISNEGSLTATATGNGTDSGADAFGIEADYTYGDIDTSGTISVTTTATGAGDADSEGIDADDTYGTVSNSGTIMASAEAESGLAEATGIDTDVSEGISNSGSISATAYSASSNAKAWGIDAEETDGNISNTGSISATATSDGGAYVYAYGIYSDGASGSIRNEGAISTTVEGYGALGYGIFSWYTDGNIVNSGNIDVNSLGEDNGQAFGITAYYTGGDIINSGDITAHSTLGDAYTLECITADFTAGSIINSGTLTAIATTYDDSEPTGIRALRTGGDIINSGSIFVLGTSEIGYTTAVGIYAYYLGGVLENSGSVEIIASGSPLRAYGIEAGGGNGTVINSGSVSVAAEQGAGFRITSGYWDIFNPGQVLAAGGSRTLEVSSAGVASLMGPFRVIFNGDPESTDYLAPLLAVYGGTLSLADATLLAQAGNDIVWNTPYPVIENDASTVSGDFAGLASANPNIDVSWEDAGSTGEGSAVVFRYNPQASVSAQALRLANFGAMQGSNLIQQRTFSELLARHIRKQEILLADSGQTASDSGFLVARAGGEAGSAVFIRPYLKTLNRPSDGELGYDSSLMGIIAGYEWLRGPELTLGLHAGLGLGSVDFKGTGYDGNDENQYIYSLGVHGAYNPGAWHFDGSATLYAARHEYEGLTGGALTIEEEDDYTSYGAELEAVGGHVFTSGYWAFMPYAGLGYSWINSPSHSTDAEDSAWDTHYGSVDEHILRSILGAQVSGNWAIGETRVIPTVGLRWEYALTDSEISISQSLPGAATVDVTDDVSRSSVIGDASLTFVKGAASMELGAMSHYNADYASYGGWLTLRYAF